MLVWNAWAEKQRMREPAVVADVRPCEPTALAHLFMLNSRREETVRKTALLLMLAIPSVCHAWGADGHKIIARIAARNLDPQARAAVKAILEGQTLVDVCSWADQVRKQPKYIFTDGCHGVKIPVGAERFELDRDCPEGRCAPAAIEKYAAIVRDPKATRAERQDALKFVIHFVSDIQCPVHASYSNAAGKVAGEVFFFGEKASIHKVWDASLIARTEKPWKRYAAELNRAITPEQRREWAKVMNPCDWATESHRAYVEFAAVPPDKNTLGEEYYQRAIPVVNERLSMGGIRLAVFLNKLLGEASATQPAATQPAATLQPVAH